MIPASFSYHRPAALAEALKILSDHGDDARVLAGGHSLIPMMKMRMANIPHLIDLQDIPDLARIGCIGRMDHYIMQGVVDAAARALTEMGVQDASPPEKALEERKRLSSV